MQPTQANAHIATPKKRLPKLEFVRFRGEWGTYHSPARLIATAPSAALTSPAFDVTALSL